MGRRWNVDPVYKYDRSNYSTFSNSPIWFVDPNGDDDYTVNKETGKVEFLQENTDADNYYTVGDGGVTRDDDGNITNSLLVSTKAGALKSIEHGKETYTIDNKKVECETQLMDFGDNSAEADQVFKEISALTNKEFSYARYNDNFKSRGKNEVYTTHQEGTDPFGTGKSQRRWFQLEKHTHFHPFIYGENSGGLKREDASPSDIGFKDKIRSNQFGNRSLYKTKLNIDIPYGQFYIYLGPKEGSVRYTDKTN